jgi:hybrid cluster-associated redox disulfide protein
MSDSGKKITADMSIFEVMQNFPETADVFRKFFQGGCFACPAAKMEKLSEGAMVHGLDIEFLLDELNKSVSGAKETATK